MEANCGKTPQSDGMLPCETAAPTLWDRTYHGRRVAVGVSEVWVEETSLTPDSSAMVCIAMRRSLPLHLEAMSYSPTGFEWGYGGSGPALLALALLLDAVGDENLALRHYQEFERKTVATLADTWWMTRREICAFVEAQSR
jgi:hypothetical protein